MALTEPHMIFRRFIYQNSEENSCPHLYYVKLQRKRIFVNFSPSSLDGPDKKKLVVKLFYIQFRKILYLFQNRYNFVPYLLLLQLLYNCQRQNLILNHQDLYTF